MSQLPNFYNINFEREVVVQGRNTTFLSITRNESEMAQNDNLVVLLYPQANTWEHYATVDIRVDEPIGGVPKKEWKFKITSVVPVKNNDEPTLERIFYGLEILNWYKIQPNLVNYTFPGEPGAPLTIEPYNSNVGLESGFTIKSQHAFTPQPGTITGIELGKYNTEDGTNWQINGGEVGKQINSLENQSSSTYWQPFDTQFKNPFDGTKYGTYGTDTGFFGRKIATWIAIPYDSNNIENNGVSIRVDYDGKTDSHLKLNILIARVSKFVIDPKDLIRESNPPFLEFPTGTYGWKTGLVGGTQDSRDYQEVHFFGYREDYVKTKRDLSPFLYDITNPIYEDQASYAILKTNPKLSGNVKITTDSNGDIWLNSFDANDELANSMYKKYAISPNSTYQRDLHYFFNKGKTPSNIVFEPYQFDNQYLNTKRTFDQQFDNFYNYGVEQLRSKFYDEDFTFLAPLWLRKDAPEFFLIFRIDGPLNIDSYLDKNNNTKFNDFFSQARLIKTYDMRASSKLGAYIRKIINDERFKERPLEVSWESDVATYWNGFSYVDGTITAKGEFLYDYYKEDRPIKEFEEYITNGFERNGIISSNLLNLEFLFNDEEADLYSINRYFGIYVKENQLAEFQIEPSVLGKISYTETDANGNQVIKYQEPEPKKDVDGEPYSTREFVQTNPNGIQLPIHYYHNTKFTNNTTNIPSYQGDVIGKFPLPAMVDDPLRFFYVKDRNDTFKRVNKLTEVDYGVPGTAEYIRATQLQLFDKQENISAYGGINNITSQFPAELLDSGNSQLVLELFDQTGTGVLEEGEEIIINADNFNVFDDDVKTYYVQVTNSVLGSSTSVKYFIGDYLTSTGPSTFLQPNANDVTPPINVLSDANLKIGDNIYIIGGGYYQITDLINTITLSLPTQISSAGQPISTLLTPVTTIAGATPGFYTLAQLSNTGLGTGATFNVNVNGAGAVSAVTISNPGANYKLSDVITIDTSSIGGTGTLTIFPATLIVTSYIVTNVSTSGNGTGFIFNVSYSATGALSVTVIDGGLNNNAGDVITISSANVGGGSATNITFTITNVLYNIRIKNLGFPGNAAPLTSIFGNAMIGKHFDGEQTYYNNPITTELQLDTYLTIKLYNTAGYTVGNAWRIDVNNGVVTKTILSGTNPIDAFIPQEYSQFRWKLIANGSGLQPADAWDYPTYDPNGTDYITHFSPEGTPEQVAAAISKAISSFDNIPVKSFAQGTAVYLKSKLSFEEGNAIVLTRQMMPTSYYTNLGFYETGVCNRNEKIKQLSFTNLSTVDLSPKFIEFVDQPTNTSYYLKITKTISGAIVTGNLNCDSTSYATLTTTGTPFWINYVGDIFEYNGLPVSLNVSSLKDGEIIEVAYSLTSSSSISQYFIGGVKRKRNRAKVSYANGTKYFTDRRTVRLGSTTAGSKIVNVDTASLYVGASVSGNGIPANTFIIDVNATSVKLNNDATATGSNVTLNIGEITSLNDSKIRNQWFQCQKGLYSEIKGWDVQGKLLYSLPYLEEPTFDEQDNISGYKSLNDNLIIQIENGSQEIYTTPEKRIVAWSIYRPILGIFSLYPIKEFDFDFILSDYAYTPTIETFPYFFKETIEHLGEIELSVNENYKLTQSSTDEFSVELSVKLNENYWYTFDTLRFKGNMVSGGNTEVILNTFYPLYRYDATEYPYLSVSRVSGVYGYYIKPYAYRGTGKRNFQREYLRIVNSETGLEEIIYPETIKLKYISAVAGANTPTLNIVNYNYSQDQDITQFNGFAGLQDITSIDDENKVQELKDNGEYVQAFTYQLLYSEYDRLRENFNKDWAVKSIVVPSINKWVQEGTDARDNYYRLNNSMAFGINNMSPSNQIDFVETSVLTNEFPYLDSVPKDYFNDALEGSRSYMFTKLDDLAVNGKTWYELLTTDDSNDWFTKYFSVGYPTEEVYSGDKITKAREERFTFFNYINGLGKSQTLFRGVKIQGVVFDDAGIVPVELNESTALKDYKFASVARFVKPGINFEKQTPVEIEVIKNDKYKTIVMIFTVYINDYRTQSGHMNYFLLYAMNDILKNENQNQLPFIPNALVTSNFNFSPYNGSYSYTNLLQMQVNRPRQGSLGGGYLQLGNKRLGGNFNFNLFSSAIQNSVTGQTNVPLKEINPTYSFNLINELATTNNKYDYAGTFITNPIIQIYAKNLTKNGFFNSFSVGSKDTSSSISIRSFFDSQDGNYTSINPLQLSFKTGDVAGRTRKISAYAPGYTGLESDPPSLLQTTSSADSNDEIETYVIGGGTDGHNSMQNYLTIGNVQSLVNSENPAIQYYKIVNGIKTPATDFRMRFVSPDSIIKSGVLHFADDTDKPQEYLNSPLIGYDIADTNTQEYMLRHRGYYEPKSRDIISFWVREDNEFSKHYEKDFLLSNTHINTSFSLSGLLRNYGINKVATSGEVLKIARESAYKSLYPYINEVAVTTTEAFVLNSSWDSKFYRDYKTTSDWTYVDGIAEMQELKSFLASKAMNVPKTHEFQTFNSTEVTYELIDQIQSIGVSTLATNTGQNMPDANKPKLIININVKARLLRQLIEDINSGDYVNEFNKLPLYSPFASSLAGLTQSQINELKTNYFNKNIINLYSVSEVSLWVLNKEGIQLLSLELDEANKTSAGYKIDKDCVVTQVTDFEFKITKTLDTKIPSGFGLSVLVKRI